MRTRDRLTDERSAAFQRAEENGTLPEYRAAEWLGLAHYNARRRAGARAVVCPRCGAEGGRLCRTPSGRSRTDDEHEERHGAGLEAGLLARPPHWTGEAWVPGVTER